MIILNIDPLGQFSVDYNENALITGVKQCINSSH